MQVFITSYWTCASFYHTSPHTSAGELARDLCVVRINGYGSIWRRWWYLREYANLPAQPETPSGQRKERKKKIRRRTVTQSTISWEEMRPT